MHPKSTLLALVPAVALCAATTPLTGKALVSALAQGGYVILMRHASSPGLRPDLAQADPANLKYERQLDDSGRASAKTMGIAFQQLQIPVGKVLSSPTYRALETARLARFPTPQVLDELREAGNNMRPDASDAAGAWLRSQVAQAPKPGTNTVIITHYPNIAEAFPNDAKDLSEGEALIYRSDKHGSAVLVGRVKITEWSGLVSTP